MKPYILTISSKNKKSINNFLKFFIRYKAIKLIVKKKNTVKKKVVTILKSPHVNKIAQEQFESRVFSSKILVYQDNPLSNVILKKVMGHLFAEMRLKIDFIISPKNMKFGQLKIFNPEKFKLTFYKNCRNSNINIKTLKKKQNKFLNKNKGFFINSLKTILKITSVFGEIVVTLLFK